MGRLVGFGFVVCLRFAWVYLLLDASMEHYFGGCCAVRDDSYLTAI